jgi:hypothetical protein
METGEISEGEILKQELFSLLQKVEAEGKLEKDYVPNKEKQKESINNLPGNVLQKLRGVYIANNLNEKSLGYFTGEFTEILTKTILEKSSPIGETLLELMQGGKRFSPKKGWPAFIHPDTIQIRVNSKGSLIVEEVVEVKKGDIDKRA